MANLDGSGLSEVWVRAAQLVKRFTGAVNLTKGDLQTQVDTKITGTAISSSSAITTQGEYALDAREKNASIEGTLANQIDALNSNLDNVDTLNAFYYAAGDMTDVINNNCNQHPYIFGYSSELNNIGMGYFSLVITIGVSREENFFFQIAISSNGKTATRAYSISNNPLWSDWTIL